VDESGDAAGFWASPKAYSVTQIETLARDPYAIYAQKILGLREVSDLSPNPDARDRGTVIHEIVEKVISETKEEWLDDDAARALFEKQMTDALAAFDPWPSVQAFYRARVLRIAPWFLNAENKRRADGDRPVALEAQGTIDITVPGFAQVGLRGYADRIDQLANQTYAIYDYKTGAPPSPAQVAAFAQQLPLEGAMLRDGAFEGVPASTVSKLAHIRLQGGDVGGKETPLSDEDQLIAEAFPKLVELLAAYADPERGYLSRARPMSITYEGAYDHLARVGEWVSADGGDSE